MKIKIIFLLVLLFLSYQNMFSQTKRNLLISDIQYDSLYVQLLHFSIVNNYDSIFRFTLPNVVEIKCLNLIQKGFFIRDSLIIDFTLKQKPKINASKRLNFQLEDVYYLQDYISSNGRIDLAIKITLQEYIEINHLKVILPDNVILLKSVQKRWFPAGSIIQR